MDRMDDVLKEDSEVVVVEFDRLDDVAYEIDSPPNGMKYIAYRLLELRTITLRLLEDRFKGGKKWTYIMHTNDLSCMPELGEKPEFKVLSSHGFVVPRCKMLMTAIRQKSPKMRVKNPDSDLGMPDAIFELVNPLGVVFAKDFRREPKPGKQRGYQMISHAQYKQWLVEKRTKTLVRMSWKKEAQPDDDR